ncbi:MAG: hypothetical protein N3D76_09815 [Geminocystis sp.]|nr:hypothetical protein [Geminocystis sp.]HIK38053.1 hypothetical protein [Geminocystis sp. M7585_C2015_104]
MGNNHPVVAGEYEVLELLEYFDGERFYLTRKIGNHKKYLVDEVEFASRHQEEIEAIQKKVDLLVSIDRQQGHNNRFLRIFQTRNTDNGIVIVYEVIEGESLRQRINKNQLWGEEEAIRGFKYLLESLASLHAHGIIHSLVKPQHIIVDAKTGNLLFSNYGKTSAEKSGLLATVTLEDKLYIPPETIRGKSCFASDIYALAMVIISLVTGRNILDAEYHEEGKLQWEKLGDYSPPFVSILNRCLAPVKSRYQRVEDVLADIHSNFGNGNSGNSNFDNPPPGYTPTELIDFDEKEGETPSTSPITISDTQLVELPTSQTIPPTKPGVDIPATVILSPQEATVEEYNPQPNALVSPDGGKSVAKNQFPTTRIFPADGGKKLLLFGFFSLITVVIISFISNYLYQKKVESIIEEINRLYDKREFEECRVLLNSEKVDSLPVAETLRKQFLGRCLLGFAQEKADKNQLGEAIKIALTIDEESADYERAKQRIDEWSEQILSEAKNLCHQQGYSPKLEEKLAQIPESSSWKKEALNLAKTCKNQNKKQDDVIMLCPGPLCPE